MKYTLVTVLVGHSEMQKFDCGCDQTFAISHLHKPLSDQYVVRHKRGFLTEAQAKKMKTACFIKEGGI